ncbi:MAG: nicotinate-nucleotide diphosphorylase (carboxylating), partial [Chthoniobacterales bacterium]|nr:nicotinate-nucleotide diphosphorylase (carboxylating) [Chthoniobacterales bacterium]
MMSLPPIAGLDADAVSHFVQSVLKEDLGLGGDVTTDLTIPADARLIATIQTREQIAVAGIDLAQVFFEALDPDVRVERLARDGDELQAGAPIMRVEGRARPMLSAERSALNTLQHLTGIATLTRSYANMIAGTSCILLDTRKTIPGLRAIEKYAARMGGAHNHRMRLDDGILIK